MFASWEIRRAVRFRAVLELPCHRCHRAAEHGLRQLVTTVAVGGHILARPRSGEALECRTCGSISPIPRQYFAQLLRRARAAESAAWVRAVPYAMSRSAGRGNGRATSAR
ncbi:hypothetical protein [Nocardia arizonensis]|uniref:hypothetical protein n=1 Tax=Nocardia arizonensis TaxID=1141647 RepID=UPI0006D13A9C|nr:hypothetical protein [Nocardia arizonensis]